MRLQLLLVLALLGLAGCSTYLDRAAEKSAVFAGLAPAIRENLRQGVVEIGYTKDLVYIALGKPDATQEKVSKAGAEEIWIYRSFSREYRGLQTIGYRRMVAFDAQGRPTFTYSEPVTMEAYRDHIEDRIRLTFRAGKVAVIEQMKAPT
ncbi:MAG: hypothetical protein ACHQ4G_03490 [Opitutales bacterium]